MKRKREITKGGYFEKLNGKVGTLGKWTHNMGTTGTESLVFRKLSGFRLCIMLAVSGHQLFSEYIFCYMLSSDQGIHSSFSGYVNQHTTIFQFLAQYERALENSFERGRLLIMIPFAAHQTWKIHHEWNNRQQLLQKWFSWSSRRN